jgi:hypothetical protein
MQQLARFGERLRTLAARQAAVTRKFTRAGSEILRVGPLHLPSRAKMLLFRATRLVRGLCYPGVIPPIFLFSFLLIFVA